MAEDPGRLALIVTTSALTRRVVCLGDLAGDRRINDREPKAPKLDLLTRRHHQYRYLLHSAGRRQNSDPDKCPRLSTVVGSLPAGVAVCYISIRM